MADFSFIFIRCLLVILCLGLKPGEEEIRFEFLVMAYKAWLFEFIFVLSVAEVVSSTTAEVGKSGV